MRNADAGIVYLQTTAISFSASARTLYALFPTTTILVSVGRVSTTRQGVRVALPQGPQIVTHVLFRIDRGPCHPARIVCGSGWLLRLRLYWLLQPRVIANPGLAAYKPPPKTV